MKSLLLTSIQSLRPPAFSPLYRALHGRHGRGQQGRQGDYVGTLFRRRLDEFLAVHVHPQVHHLEAGPFHHHRNQVLADVVQSALACADGISLLYEMIPNISWQDIPACLICPFKFSAKLRMCCLLGRAKSCSL